MSGFGNGSASGNGRRYHVECASVNRKGLEILVTLPRYLSPLEPQIREEVQKTIVRGRIHISVTDEIIKSQQSQITLVDQNAAQQALEELKQTQQALKLSAPITMELILRMPGVLCTEVTEPINLVATWKPLKIALQKALLSLSSMKMKEGKNLITDLKKRFHLLEKITKKIATRVPIHFQYRRDQLQTRLATLGVPLSQSDPSFLRELAFLAERSDISEELTRLKSHLRQSREILGDSSSTARTLDYLAQEMFREFNTLSNKANDAEISHWVVQSKSELDKIREQLANLE